MRFEDVKIAWIGAYQASNDVNAPWLWKAGQTWGYTNWNPGEPNHWEGAEDCAEAHLDSKGWNDVNCQTTQRIPLCEFRDWKK